LSFDVTSIATKLEQGADGIWYGKDQQTVSYPDEGHDSCFAIEEKSFWFRHRNNCILSVIRNFPPDNDGPVFDIGGGNGFVSKFLSESGIQTVLLEPGPNGAKNARLRGLKTVVCATTDTAGFVPGSMEGIGLFDVIEHIEDDALFLQTISNLLTPGGRVYLTVPAYSFLWSEEDKRAGHYRRYSLRQICSVVRRSGLSVDYATYIFNFLPLPIFLFRTLPFRIGLNKDSSKVKKQAARDHCTKKGPVSVVLDKIGKWELRKVSQNKKVAFGGSCLVVATKTARSGSDCRDDDACYYNK